MQTREIRWSTLPGGFYYHARRHDRLRAFCDVVPGSAACPRWNPPVAARHLLYLQAAGKLCPACLDFYTAAVRSVLDQEVGMGERLAPTRAR